VQSRKPRASPSSATSGGSGPTRVPQAASDPWERDARAAGLRVAAAPPPKAIPSPGSVGPGDGLGGLRSHFEAHLGYDFGRIRIHAEARSAAAAAALGARAFTSGRDIHFGRGAWAPHTPRGRGLIAHELTHVAQQGAAPALAGAPPVRPAPRGVIQRDIAEGELPATPVEQVMADPSYFENGLERIEFFEAQLAILHYGNGTSIRLGLVPDLIEAPFEAVDYRSTRSEHLTVSSEASTLGRGSIRFLPRGAEARMPEGLTFGDLPRVVEDVGRTIRFTHHPTGRIVPTEVNAISAPRLCQALRQAEEEYAQAFDAMAEGTIQALRTLEWIVILRSLLPAPRAATGGGRAAGGAATAGASMVGRAQTTLAQLFARLLRTGGTTSVTVEGVGFGGVRAAMRGSELVVTRSTIVNASQIPGRGRLIHAAFERAAVQAARQAGASTARIALELVQNPRWAAYLESRGYAFEVIANRAGGFTRVLTKVLPL